MTNQTHSWTEVGRYSLSVEATDNQTYSQTTEFIVLIDAIEVGEIGYFTDDDGDETYDMFHSFTNEITTALDRDDNGTYLIDSDDDGKWDYLCNIDTDTLVEYVGGDDKKSTPFFEFVGIIALIVFFVFVKKKRFL